jgi:hypothetical protein
MRVRILATAGATDLQFSEWWFMNGLGYWIYPSSVTANGGRGGRLVDLTTRRHDFYLCPVMHRVLVVVAALPERG